MTDPKAQERNLKRRYGIDRDRYERVKVIQGGRCAICRRATGKTKALAVDHNHRTARLRGLLCGRCNNRIGWVEANLAAILDYILYPPFDLEEAS